MSALIMLRHNRPVRPTAKDVKKYRADHQCGAYEAQNALEAIWRRKMLKNIKDAAKSETAPVGRDTLEAMLMDLVDVVESTL